MKLITRFIQFPITPRLGPCCLKTLKSSLRYLWAVYSDPAPAGKDVLTLLALCFLITVVTGGLIFYWLSNILQYNHVASSTTACVYSASKFLFSFLCHPLRCVLTMGLPTLCTKQGRKLIISTAVMVVVLNVLPNITMNVGAVLHILKCTSGGFARSLLNSSEQLEKAKRELFQAIKVKGCLFDSFRNFSHFTHINVSEVKHKFADMTSQLEKDFSHANHLLDEYKLLLNRILAAIFGVYLILNSAFYLKSYLTSVRFDNSYVSKELLQKAADNRIQILPSDIQNMVHYNSCKITKQELTNCLTTILKISLYFIAVMFVLALDHIVFYLVEESKPWLLDIPSASVNIRLKYKVDHCYILRTLCTELVNFNQNYEWAFSPEAPSHCDVALSLPDLRVRVLLGFLFLLSYTMVFLEVYARRIRKRVSASFFQKQEEKRIAYLLKKIKAKHYKEENPIFHVNAKHRESYVTVGRINV